MRVAARAHTVRSNSRMLWAITSEHMLCVVVVVAAAAAVVIVVVVVVVVVVTCCGLL